MREAVLVLKGAPFVVVEGATIIAEFDCAIKYCGLKECATGAGLGRFAPAPGWRRSDHAGRIGGAPGGAAAGMDARRTGPMDAERSEAQIS
jgi:hypothetical protein